MKPKRLSKKIPLGPGEVCTIRPARANERDAIRELYQDVYGDTYTLPLIREPERTLQTIKDPDHLWLVAEHRKRLIGSVLFAFDRTEHIGKVFAAVIRSEYRGHDLTQHAIAAGLDSLLQEASPLEIFYATTRTVTPAPARLVSRLGFVSCGVFPNVHKVTTPETHGLHIRFRPSALLQRQRNPRLIPEVVPFFEIAKETLGLDDSPKIESSAAVQPSGALYSFVIEQDELKVLQVYRKRLEEKSLRWSFFPFHEPNVLCHTPDHAYEVFIQFHRTDGYGVILGIKGQPPDMSVFLDQLCGTAHQLGLAYIELLVSAFDPAKQSQALAARFLPCAYFPAMKVTTGGFRMDYLVFSRSFQNLDFTGITLEGTPRRYLQAFMKCWYAMVLSQAPNFEKQDLLFR